MGMWCVEGWYVCVVLGCGVGGGCVVGHLGGGRGSAVGMECSGCVSVGVVVQVSYRWLVVGVVGVL